MVHFVSKAAYYAWCNDVGTLSKIPKDAKRRKAERASKLAQSLLDPHLKEIEKPRVVPYSDELFNSVAREWLIQTDQVRTY